MKTLISFFVFLVVISATANEFSGFYDPQSVKSLPIKSPQESVFKLLINKEMTGAKMFGTVFALAPDIFLTNVHNITMCLRDHGLFDIGYDGKRGPLSCKTLALVDSRGSLVDGVELLGSNPRHHNDEKDFAVIRVKGVVAHSIQLRSDGPKESENVSVIGFPSTTYRNSQDLKSKVKNLVEVLSKVIEVEKKVAAHSTDKSEDLFSIWLKDGIANLSPLSSWNEFVAGAILGQGNSLLSWQKEDVATYRSRLNDHFSQAKYKIYALIQVAEKALAKVSPVTHDANDTMKVSLGLVARVSGNFAILRGDATPGSSGSVVLDSHGAAVGILFQIRALANDSDELCLLDALMTDFESIRFSYCPALGPAVVSSKAIVETLKLWGIKL